MKTAITDIILKVPFFLQMYELRLTKRLQVKEQLKAKNIQIWNSLGWNQEQKMLHYLKDGIPIYLFKDSVLSRMIFEGTFELNEVAFVKSHLKEGDIFIDIGSNIGLFSLVASGKVGASGKVIAFEPSPTTFNRLKLNISLARFNNVEIRNIGLSDKNTFLNLNILGSGYDAWDTFSNVDESKLTNSVTVPVSTLDDQLANIDKSRISLVKIDVEGWEKFVLLGGENFLKSYSPILLVEFTEINTKAAGYEVGQLYDLLVEWGYEWFSFEDSKLKPARKKDSYPYDNLIAKKKLIK